jgi:hypothetical protein
VPITYAVDDDQQVVSIVISGELTIEELREHWTRLLADPEARRIGRSVADFRRSSLRFTSGELSAAINSVLMPLLDGIRWKTAYVVDNVQHYRFVHDHMAFGSQYLSGATFHDPASALKWLRGD